MLVQKGASDTRMTITRYFLSGDPERWDMAYSRRNMTDQTFLARVGALVVGCTAVLTLSFFGIVAILTGDAAGIGTRLPFYALGMAAVFVAAVVGLEQRRREGRAVLAAASLLAVGGGLLLTLGGEGVAYAGRNPEQVLGSGHVLYLVAAGLIATGIGYWGLHHWRDVVDPIRL